MSYVAEKIWDPGGRARYVGFSSHEREWHDADQWFLPSGALVRVNAARMHSGWRRLLPGRGDAGRRLNALIRRKFRSGQMRYPAPTETAVVRFVS